MCNLTFKNFPDTLCPLGGLVCCWPGVGGATADEGGRGPTSSGLECQTDTPGTWLSCSSACPRVANDITRSNYVFQTA